MIHLHSSSTAEQRRRRRRRRAGLQRLGLGGLGGGRCRERPMMLVYYRCKGKEVMDLSSDS